MAIPFWHKALAGIAVAGLALPAGAQNSASTEQREHDRDAFRNEAIARRHLIIRDPQSYARQQQAFADAMAAWRIKDQECVRGVIRSCGQRAPMAADFLIP